MSKLILSLIPKGHPDHPRFLIANQNKQFWTGTGWSEVEDHGLLFADEREIGNVATNILMAHCADKPVYRFTVPLEIEIWGEEAPGIVPLVDESNQRAGLEPHTVVGQTRLGQVLPHYETRAV